MPKPGETAPEGEAKETEQQKAEAEGKGKENETPAPDPKKETTVGEALKTEKKETKEEKMVPESALIKYKNEAKDTKKALDDLRKNIEDGAPKKETSKTIAALKEKYPDSSDFIDEFAQAVRADTEAEIDAKVSERTKPLEEKDQAERIDKIFGENYDKTLAAMPEFKDVANRDVVKSLSLDPKNSNKTFAQILEMAYGHLIKGRKTLESTKPRGGKSDAEIDMTRANQDPEYFKEIMSDPDMKAQYNKNLEKRLKL